MALRRLLVINPNTSVAFTEKIRRVAESCVAGVDVETVQPRSGPRSIESVYDELLSAPGTLECFLERRGEVDGVVVACFSDHPVTAALREVSDGAPVVGLLEGAVEGAHLLGDTFGIVTTSKSWEPLLEAGVARLGFAPRCAGIEAANVPVLALEADRDAAVLEAMAMAARRVAERSDVVILGCAGFGPSYARALRDALGGRVPVVEPVEAAVRACAAAGPSVVPAARPRFQHLDGDFAGSIFATGYAPREFEG